MSERRQAVIDLGSNSFRLVVFTWAGEGRAAWWKRTDEVHEAVRIGAGLDATGELGRKPMERALQMLELYAHFCRATGITDVRPVATSAIRDAANQEAFLEEARRRTWLEIRVLPREEEARYGYLAAVNSTTLADGVALDIGGGSLQLSRLEGRIATDAKSWRLGAVRMTERFLDGKTTSPKQVKALRAHVEKKLLSRADWLEGSGTHGRRLVGVGGAMRNLAAAASAAAGMPDFGVQGVAVSRKQLGALIDEMLALPAAERGSISGIKPDRADVILAAAVVIDTVMDLGEFDAVEATEAGLREGIFFETLLAGTDPPLFDDVRRASVLNLAAQYHPEFAHTQHVAELTLEMWDALGAAGLHACDPVERDLLWAAAMLHDIGTAVDYDDHHKHSRYLILSAGLPGFSARETALIAQLARYHRKGTPTLGELEPLAAKGDEDLLRRGAALLRLSEQLERARDQAVHEAVLTVDDGHADLRLSADEDVTLARWMAERQTELFERAFGVALRLVES
ncbi:MAG: exopolyphosphatase / guanosine-5-triphosphate,3-diphosphate pyrophosphatase [Solirubrobacteraceae bacterium]|nr:exopolyphosphatase / guanosine-5-triphosphate,3-diphosphate pyrophosphatase [Solirubrobacteraceae bacterium]